VYLRRGKIHRGPCVDCGVDPEDERVEMHHPDYDHPLNVVWLCVPCRRDRIREAAEAGAAEAAEPEVIGRKKKEEEEEASE